MFRKMLHLFTIHFLLIAFTDPMNRWVPTMRATGNSVHSWV